MAPLEIMGSNAKALTLSFFPRLNFPSDNENFAVVPDSSRPDVKVHTARQHINIFSHAIIYLTGCVTENVLITFDVFPNVYPSELSMHSPIPYYTGSRRGLRTQY